MQRLAVPPRVVESRDGRAFSWLTRGSRGGRRCVVSLAVIGAAYTRVVSACVVRSWWWIERRYDTSHALARAHLANLAPTRRSRHVCHRRSAVAVRARLAGLPGCSCSISVRHMRMHSMPFVGASSLQMFVYAFEARLQTLVVSAFRGRCVALRWNTFTLGDRLSSQQSAHTAADAPSALVTRNGEAFTPNPGPAVRDLPPPPVRTLEAASSPGLGVPESRGGAPPRRGRGAALRRAVPSRRVECDSAGAGRIGSLALEGVGPATCSGYSPRGRGGPRPRPHFRRRSGVLLSPLIVNVPVSQLQYYSLRVVI